MDQAQLQQNLIQRIAMGDLLRRRARDYAQHEALVDFHNGKRRSLTYLEFNQQANQLAQGLRQQGLQAGQRLALMGTNRIEFMVSLFACYKAGVVAVPINFLQNPETIHYNFAHAEVSAVIYEDVLTEIVDASTQKPLPKLQQRFVIGTHTKDTSLSSLMGDQSDAELEDCIIEDRDTAHIIYTSGTTSDPKGAESSHLALFISSLSNPLTLGLPKQHNQLNILPLFHCAALSMSFSCLQLGGKLVMHPNFDPQKAADTLEQESIHSTALLPLMWRALLQVSDIQSRDFSSMQAAIYAMAPMDGETLKQLRATFKCPFHLGSGQTEFAPAACTYFDETPTEFGEGNYWGVPNITTDQAIIDDQGNEVPQGEIGEICWRGPQVMSGYLKNSEATNEAREFGWHHTGDLGLIDSKGQLLFVDRKKDTIKSGGENVSSMKVEQALLSHSAVIQTAAFGIPHPHWGEAVVACVQLTPGEAFDETALIEHSKNTLGGFETPKRIVQVDSLPMTGTGKVRKVALREEYAELFD